MNSLVYVLFAFVAVGLAKDRLGPRRAYFVMSFIVLVYVIHAY